MTPKLYLIESEERDGLVKIGFAGSSEKNERKDVVFERIKSYSVGISDQSTVYETPGTFTFEKFFHSFISKKQKKIQIKFALTGRIKRAKEWFLLPSNVSKIFVDAFSKEHPSNLSELSDENLPIFLSGALSAINWHAKNITAIELAEMVAQDRFSSIFNEMPIEPNDQREQGLFPRFEDTESESIENLYLQQIPQLVAQSERLKAEMAEIREMELHRTIIALVSVVMVFFLLVTGAPISGSLFAIFASLLYASWPSLQPLGASMLVILSDRLINSAKKSRQRENDYDE